MLFACFAGDSLYAFVFAGMFVCVDNGSVVRCSKSCCRFPSVCLFFLILILRKLLSKMEQENISGHSTPLDIYKWSLLKDEAALFRLYSVLLFHI